MKLTLVVATHNGIDTLPQSLDSLTTVLKQPAANELPNASGRLDINAVYIDNNSNDGTFSLLQTVARKHSHITVLQQTKKGKNAALNTVFEYPALLGDVLIFSDDDVIFPLNLFSGYAVLAEQHPNQHIFGGVVNAHHEQTPPPALLAGIDAVVAFAITPTDKGYQTGLIAPEKLHGPNMAIRRSVFDQGVRFNETIGPNGSNYMMGSETELLLRLRESGHQAIFDRSIQVGHLVAAEQLSDSWLQRRAYKAGRSMLMHQLKNQTFKPTRELLGYPLWAWRMSMVDRLTAMLSVSKSERFYRALWRGHHLLGYCHEYKNYRATTRR